jgi:hypothetical protein
MVNKLHGVKFPKNKKGYTKLTEEMADFYESIIEDKFEQSGRWPVSAKVANADLKVGDTVAYLYLWGDLVTRRRKLILRRRRSNLSSWVACSCLSRTSGLSTCGRTMRS